MLRGSAGSRERTVNCSARGSNRVRPPLPASQRIPARSSKIELTELPPGAPIRVKRPDAQSNRLSAPACVPTHSTPFRSKNTLSTRSLSRLRGSLRVVTIVNESSRRAIEAVDPATVRSKPQRARGVFANRGDLVGGQAVGILRVVAVECEPSCPSIQPVEARLGPDPQDSLAVAEHRPDHVVGQAVRAGAAVHVIDERRWLPDDGGDPLWVPTHITPSASSNSVSTVSFGRVFDSVGSRA